MDKRNKKYMMHKYWGKKPAGELKDLILKYSSEGDILLDPFAGYGSFASEAILNGRNAISNDLNPISNFITKVLTSTSIDFSKLDKMIEEIYDKTILLREEWFYYEGKEVITTLRDNNGRVKKIKIKNDDNKLIEVVPSELYIENLKVKEENHDIGDWFPNNTLIPYSRISAKVDMKVSDLFDVRSLSCHARLLSIINNFEDSQEKDALLLAFTSNLANCSKLVPPIKSRGDMSQGAWMTGFYIGPTYLENNVFHYFFNRVRKVVNGKKEFMEEYSTLFPKGKIKIESFDAKDLLINSNSIDLVFTDFPYGDAVPYFEQSALWNLWLNFNVDYENEIVISDSKLRKKSKEQFQIDIDQAISEIYRVLKKDKYFIFTYHSLSGFEWSSITNSLFKHGFEVEDCKLLTQKTFPPRQLNRKNTIKGDVLIVCRKREGLNRRSELTLEEQNQLIKDLFIRVIELGHKDTNSIIVEFLKEFLNLGITVTDSNIFSHLSEVAYFDEVWSIKNT